MEGIEGTRNVRRKNNACRRTMKYQKNKPAMHTKMNWTTKKHNKQVTTWTPNNFQITLSFSFCSLSQIQICIQCPTSHCCGTTYKHTTLPTVFKTTLCPFGKHVISQTVEAFTQQHRLNKWGTAYKKPNRSLRSRNSEILRGLHGGRRDDE